MSANERQVGGGHYKTGGEEHWDRVSRLGLDYFQGQITKYVERCWKKNGVQDLEKARHFLDKYIELSKAGEVVRETERVAAHRAGWIKAVKEQQAVKEQRHVSPTGYVGWTYEGGTKDWDAFRCLTCRLEVKVDPGDDPNTTHECGAEPTRAYVDQDGN